MTNSLYSLWRGDVLLGHIAHDGPVAHEGVVFGALAPTAEFPPVRMMSQHTMRDWPGAPVFQHVETHGAPSTDGSSRQFASDGPRSAADLARESVPTEHQLVLRDSENAPIATNSIAIMGAPRGPGVWRVIIKLAAQSR